MNLFKTKKQAEREARRIAEFYTETVVVLKHYDGYEIEMYPEWANTDRDPILFIDPHPNF
jgi:hypothetical protein|tara:strand:+ start:545 stop:724 length:180 start_codon:yes stop_codon:yes gene_type:complete